MSSLHPTSQCLIDFSVGKLEEDQSAEIMVHLDQCPQCRSTIENLGDAGDTLAASLRREAPADVYHAEAELGQAMAAIESLVQPPDVPHKDSRTAAPLGNVRDYQLLEVLGQGGMGTVYKARHRRLKRIVALKVLPPGRVRDSAAVARFEREMEAVGKLEHPHIVRALDAGEEDGNHYLVMEYVEGLDLSELVRQHGPLAIADACELIRQAAIGLQHAHTNGLVHRDIKPSNLMLSAAKAEAGTPLPEVKILDLGLARLGSGSEVHPELTASGQMMGTLDYMAPEQGDNSREVDGRADIYSLGATLYKLLSGEAIFGGPEYKSVIRKVTAIATQEAPPIQSRRADVPDALAEVVARMIAKTPDERFQSPAEVAAALAPLAAGNNLAALCSSNRNEQTLVQRPHSSISTSVGNMAQEGDTATTMPQVRPEPKPATKPQRPWHWWFATGGALAAIGILAAVLTIGIDGRGTLRIETFDEDVVVRVLRGGEEVEIIDTKSKQKVRLAAGEYELQLAKGKNSWRLSTDRFQLRRRGKVVVSVERLKSPAPRTKPAAVSQDELPHTEFAIVSEIGGGGFCHWSGLDRNAVSISPDGIRIASAGLDGVATVWDKKGNVLARHAFDEYRLSSCKWMPDGKQLLLGARDAAVAYRWLPATDKPPVRLPLPDELDAGVRGFAPTPDGRLVAVGAQDIVFLNFTEGKPPQLALTVDHPGSLRNLTAGPKGEYFSTVTGARTVRFLRRDGQWEPSKNVVVYENSRTLSNAVAFHPSGEAIAVCGCNRAERLQLVNLKTKEQKQLPAEGGMMWDLDFNSDGSRLLVAARSGYVLSYDTTSGKRVARLEVGDVSAPGAYRGLDVGPNDEVATGGPDHRVTLWDGKSDRDAWGSWQDRGRLYSLALHGDGDLLLASANTREIAAYSLKQKTLLWTHAVLPSQVHRLAIHPQGERFATVGSEAIVWDLESREKIASRQLVHWASDCAFHPSRPLLAVTYSDGPLIWNWEIDEEYFRPQVEGIPLAVAFSPDGNRMAIGTGDGSSGGLFVWDIRSLKLIAAHRNFPQPVSSVAFGPAGEQILAGARYGPFYGRVHSREGALWLCSANSLERRMLSLDLPPVHVRLSHDGTKFLVAGFDGAVTAIDARTFKPTHRFQIGPRFGMVADVVDHPQTGHFITADGNERSTKSLPQRRRHHRWPLPPLEPTRRKNISKRGPNICICR